MFIFCCLCGAIALEKNRVCGRNQERDVHMPFKTIFITVSLTATLMCSASWAADAIKGDLPAVSAINGKIELSAGWADIDPIDPTAVFHGGASLSVPLGDRFGLQADIAALSEFGDTYRGAALHAFTRNPESYLLGVTGGFGSANAATFSFIGPEAEFYADRVSIEAYAGYMNLDVAGVQSSQFFGFGDVAYYADDNLRLSVGASTVAGFKSGHINGEWQLSDTGLPLSLTAEGRLGDSGLVTASLGLKLYFGAEDKTLIRRHREDDPRNRTLDIFNAAGMAFKQPQAGVPSGCPPGESCVFN